MKSNKKSFIVFAVIAIFVIVGMISTDYVRLFGGVPLRIIRRESTIADEIDYVNDQVGTRLSYHDALMDLNSVVLRLSNSRYVDKGDDVIALSDKNLLCTQIRKINDEEISGICQDVLKLQETAKKNNAEFLYVYAPDKEYWSTLPDNVDNYSVHNHDALMKSFNKAGINTLDLSLLMKEENKSVEDTYFITDHHWKPETGFWAYTKLCERLNEQYGFAYDKSLTDISNYNQTIYPKWFLGSSGKKVGRYYSPLGIDDLNLITPKFPTDLFVDIVSKNETRSGSFEEALLEYSQIENKDYYSLNPYDVYGFNFRERIIYNNKALNDKTILIISDSYAISVNPFLSLNAKEIHIVDVRDYEWFDGEKINLKEYIPRNNPDYVILFYKGVRHGDGSYDFF